MTVIVVVIDESKDSLIKRRAVFLRLDVNIVMFYRSPKSFYPDVVLCPAPAVHTDLLFMVLSYYFLTKAPVLNYDSIIILMRSATYFGKYNPFTKFVLT